MHRVRRIWNKYRKLDMLYRSVVAIPNVGEMTES